MPGVPPLDRCVRISIGPEDAMAVVEEVLPLAVDAAG
jgi:histidinol-phosphate aminotransferase